MRKPIIAGNWKMYKNKDEAVQFIYKVSEEMPSLELVDSVICAPFIALKSLVKRQGDNLRIGAQNMHFEEQGAFTGEIAPSMLTNIGVSYVIIGHSERRAMFNETDETCNKKLHAAYKHGLVPILCVGESLEEREAGITMDLIAIQVKKAFAGIAAEDAKKVVIAYEPIWAIGTGKTATSEQAEEVCKGIRECIAEMYDEATAEAVRIQYGGSMKPSNAAELLAKKDIDGGLIGGASLKAEDFSVIVKAASK